ncbi:hypothetical protein Scep_000840 [Stephania cephalantha]|uniref:Uncharacterized protein n=1 Tax=Stephania cephalantha TaxID=152367 RepID=A0AAP0LAM0_9MAGN
MAEVWMAEVAKRVSWVRENVQLPKPNWPHHQVVAVEEQVAGSLLMNSPTSGSVGVGSATTNKHAHEATSTLSDATLCMLIDRFTPC